MNRRRALGLLAVAPGMVPLAHARDYASEDEVRAAIDGLAGEVEARLAALVSAVPHAAPFVASARADLARHRRERGGTAAAPPRLPQPTSLARLRAALQQLVHAHAEGLPALREGAAVQRLAGHMVDLARLLTVVDLWMESEGFDE